MSFGILEKRIEKELSIQKRVPLIESWFKRLIVEMYKGNDNISIIINKTKESIEYFSNFEEYDEAIKFYSTMFYQIVDGYYNEK